MEWRERHLPDMEGLSNTAMLEQQLEWREKSHLPVEEGLTNVKMAEYVDCRSLEASGGLLLIIISRPVEERAPGPAAELLYCPRDFVAPSGPGLGELFALMARMAFTLFA